MGGMGVWREGTWEGLHVEKGRGECYNYILIKKFKTADHICIGRYGYYIFKSLSSSVKQKLSKTHDFMWLIDQAHVKDRE